MERKTNKFLYGAVILTIISIIAKIIGAFYRVPLISLIGSKGLGYFQLIFPIFTFFLIIITSGLSNGMSKLISMENKNKNYFGIKKIVNSALILLLISSIVLSIIFVIISFPLSTFQGNKELYLCYFALIPALIFSSLLCVFRGYFQGLENMLPSGLSQIIEQIFKLVFSLLLSGIFIKKSIVFAVFGAFLGISISEFFAFLYLLIRYVISKNKFQKLNQQFFVEQNIQNKIEQLEIINENYKNENNKNQYANVIENSKNIISHQNVKNNNFYQNSNNTNRKNQNGEYENLNQNNNNEKVAIKNKIKNYKFEKAKN